MTLIAKPPQVKIPVALYERVLQFEGGKYTPTSVILTAVEEWLDEKKRAPTQEPEATAPAPGQVAE